MNDGQLSGSQPVTGVEPVAELDARYSGPGATATDWADAVEHLAEAPVFWLSTVRPDGRPHVTPLLAVWLDDALYFSTGPGERKAANLAGQSHCVLTTGRDALDEGLDLVVEGDAVRVVDETVLRRLAAEYLAKYGPDWRFTVRDGSFYGEGGEALVFGVAPAKVLGFAKGQFSQTRWRFPRPAPRGTE